MLLQNFVLEREDLQGGVIEYVDDGYTGTNFNRPGFKRMIEDAKTGKINTILTKDLSRLGRDYIGVGDYLDQIFPTLGIRFIAVNSNYDSNDYIGKTVGLDIAISNLVNSLYSKDISKKLRAALQTKWENGGSTSARLPYGYCKDASARGGWKIEPEAANCVKMIFYLACKSWDTRMIAEHLNELGIMPPGRYREMRNEYGGNRKATDEECLWDPGKVRTILTRYEYTGAFVHNCRQKIMFGSRATRKVPEKEWYITENAHDAIVSREVYENAQAAIRYMPKDRYKDAKHYLLKGKIRCGNCRLALAYLELAYEDVFFCPHKVDAGRQSGCCSDYYPVKLVEDTVKRSLQKQMDILRSMDAHAGKETENARASAKHMRKEIDILKAERVRQYEAFAEGLVGKEAYIRKKEELTERIDGLQKKLEDADGFLQKEDSLTAEIVRIKDVADSEMKQEKLTKKMVDEFIETVYVYDKKTVEVVFKFEDVLKEVLERYPERKEETGG